MYIIAQILTIWPCDFVWLIFKGGFQLWHMYHELSHSCTQNFLPGENAGGAPVHVQPQPWKGAIGEGRPLLHSAMGTIQVRPHY